MYECHTLVEERMFVGVLDMFSSLFCSVMSVTGDSWHVLLCTHSLYSCHRYSLYHCSYWCFILNFACWHIVHFYQQQLCEGHWSCTMHIAGGAVSVAVKVYMNCTFISFFVCLWHWPVVGKSQIESFPQISNHLGKWFKSSCQISNLKSLKNFKSQIFKLQIWNQISNLFSINENEHETFIVKNCSLV